MYGDVVDQQLQGVHVAAGENARGESADGGLFLFIGAIGEDARDLICDVFQLCFCPLGEMSGIFQLLYFDLYLFELSFGIVQGFHEGIAIAAFGDGGCQVAHFPLRLIQFPVQCEAFVFGLVKIAIHFMRHAVLQVDQYIQRERTVFDGFDDFTLHRFFWDVPCVAGCAACVFACGADVITPAADGVGGHCAAALLADDETGEDVTRAHTGGVMYAIAGLALVSHGVDPIPQFGRYDWLAIVFDGLIAEFKHALVYFVLEKCGVASRCFIQAGCD